MGKLANIFEYQPLQTTNLKEKNANVKMEFFIFCVSSFLVAILSPVYLLNGFQRV